jgi:hypothetical protein
MSLYRYLGALFVALLLTAPAAQAWAGNTSCDIVTGASCWKGEGCDCDHDGYVISTGKASKYCHFDKCPQDANDKDATVLGKVSTYNADGDGWTKNYDCDDNDPCVGKTCGVNTCPAPDPDVDKDGSPASKDCNDNDPNIHPGAGIACCDCNVLADPAKVAALGCKGCPLSNPPADAGSTDAGSADAGSTTPDTAAPDTTSPDTSVPDISTPDTGPDTTPADTATDGGKDATTPTKPDVNTVETTTGADAGAQPEDGAGALTDAGSVTGQPNELYVGAGGVSTGAPPAPGCAASPVAPRGALAAVVVVMALALLRAFRRRAAALALVAVGLTSCATVQPWQRQQLAHRCMVIGRNAGELTLEQHAFQYREGAAGGFGGGGGGCGCN